MKLSEELAEKFWKLFGAPIYKSDDPSMEAVAEIASKLFKSQVVSNIEQIINDALERSAQEVLGGLKQEAAGDSSHAENWALRLAAKRIRALKG